MRFEGRFLEEEVEAIDGIFDESFLGYGIGFCEAVEGNCRKGCADEKCASREDVHDGVKILGLGFLCACDDT